MVFTGYSARYLGVADWGIISGALAFVTMLQVLGDLGLSQVAAREIARNPSVAAALLGNAAIVKVGLSLLLGVLVWLLGTLLGYGDLHIRITGILVLHAIFTSYSNLAYALFQAKQRLEYRALGHVLSSCLMLAGAFVVVRADGGVIGLAGVYLVSSLAVLALNGWVVRRKFVPPRLALDLTVVGRAIRAGLPFSATLFVSGFFLQLDLMLLTLLRGSDETGLYGAAATVITVATFVADAFVLATFPVTSRLYVENPTALRKAIDRSAKYLLVLGMLFACGGTLLADVIVDFVYGADFTGAVLPLQLLCLYLPVRFVSHVLGWALPSMDREPLRTMGATAAALTNLVLNLVLIRPYGLIGAAVGSVISQIVLYALYSRFVSKHIQRASLRPVVWRTILSAVAMAVVVVGLRPYLNIVFVTAAGIGAFAAVLWAVGTVDSEDAAVARELIRQVTGSPAREASQR